MKKYILKNLGKRKIGIGEEPITIDNLFQVDVPQQISIQDQSGTEQFAVTDSIKFENVVFEPSTKKIKIENLFPLTAYLDTNSLMGNDATAQLENPKRPFFTLSALLQALPPFNGEIWTIYINSSNNQILPVTRRMTARNLNFVSYKFCTIDFTDVMEDDGVTPATQVFTTNLETFWRFSGDNISIRCNYTGQRIFGGTLHNWVGTLNELKWEGLGAQSYNASILLGDQNDLYIKKVFQALGATAMLSISGKLRIGELVVNRSNWFFRAGAVDLVLDKLTQVGTTPFNWTLSSLSNHQYTFGDITFNGEIMPVTNRLTIKGSLSDNCRISVNGTSYVTGTQTGGLGYITTGYINNNLVFENFTGRIKSIASSGVAHNFTFITCNLTVDGVLINNPSAHADYKVIFKGFNQINQLVPSSFLLNTLNPVKVLVEGELKTNAKQLGQNVHTDYLTSTFKEKEKEIVIRSKYDIVNRDLDSSVSYIIDGDIDLTKHEYIIVPSGGLTITGYSFDASRIRSTNIANHQIFKSPIYCKAVDTFNNTFLGINNGVYVNDSKIGTQSLYFDGAVVVSATGTTHSHYNPGLTQTFNYLRPSPTNPYSFPIWFKADVNPFGQYNAGAIIIGATSTHTNGNICVYIEPVTGHLKVNFRNAITTISTSVGTDWHFIELKCNDNVGECFYDGVTYPLAVGTYSVNNFNFYLGSATGGNYTFRGNIDAFLAYNRVRTEAESLAMWNNGSGRAITLEPTDGLVARHSMQVDNESILVGGSGNLVIHNMAFTNTGIDSGVFHLIDTNGSHALEMVTVNFEGCQTIGTITSYRQGTGITIGFYGCADGLTMDGLWQGFKLTNTNGFTFGANAIMFKRGPALLFSNRFYLEINVSLASTAKICDFGPENFTTNKLLQVNTTLAKIDGVINPVTATPAFFPNILPEDPKASFVDNIGLLNTTILATSDADAASKGVDVSGYYVEPSTGYLKVRMS